MPLIRTRIEATDAKGHLCWDREGPMYEDWAKHEAETQFMLHENWTLVEVYQDKAGYWERVHEVHTPWLV